MNGYVVIKYGRDLNSYFACTNWQKAKEKFIETIRQFGTVTGDPEVLAIDEEDMEELADCGIYCHNCTVIAEISPCTINLTTGDKYRVEP